MKLEGNSGDHLVHSPAPGRAIFKVRASCSGLCSTELWNSSRMEISQPLWQNHDEVIAVFEDISFLEICDVCVWITTLDPVYMPQSAAQVLNFLLPGQYVDFISGIFCILTMCMWKTSQQTKNTIPLGCIQCVQQRNAEFISIMLNMFVIAWKCL